MTQKRKQIIDIPFQSLKEGHHQFDYQIDDQFFEQYDHSLIERAKLNVAVDFEKKPSMFNVAIKVVGTIDGLCDRCSDEISIPIEGEDHLIVKFDQENYQESTDDILTISPSDNKLDISDFVYEVVSLSLPSKMLHQSEKDCDQEVIKKLKELSQKSEEHEADPRWAALNKLKN